MKMAKTRGGLIHARVMSEGPMNLSKIRIMLGGQVLWFMVVLSYHVTKRKRKYAHPPLKLDAFQLEASTHYLFETCFKLLLFFIRLLSRQHTEQVNSLSLSLKNFFS